MVGRVVTILAVFVLVALGWWSFCAPTPEPVLQAEPAPERTTVTPPESFQQLAERSEDVAVRETEGATIVELNDVLFDFDRSEIRSDGEPVLRALVAYLQEDPERRVRIDAHADSVGSEDYNRRLSERRAEVVRRSLVARGIAPGRLTVRAYGESLPAASNATAAGRQRNRRVELSIDRRGAR